MLRRRFPLVIAAAFVAAVGCSSDTVVANKVQVKIVSFRAVMNSASEVPTNTSTGSGVFTATLDTATNIFTYDFTFTGLTSAVNNGHIHGPASTTVAAGTTINFQTLAGATFSFGATTGTGHGVSLLTSANQITATINGDSLRKLLFAGQSYANIHTVNNPGGEIRGQILLQP